MTANNFLTKIGKVPTGIALAFLICLLLFQGDHLFISWVGLFFALAAIWELTSLLERQKWQRVSTMASVFIISLFCKWLLSGSRESVNEFVFLSLLFWIIIGPLSLISDKRPPRFITISIGSFLIISAWLSLSILVEYDRWLLIFGIIAVCLADTFAWFFGKNFGKTLLAPKISPNKTWEGILGALFVLLIFATFIWGIYLQDTYPHWLVIVIVATICALSVLGDLVESTFKRQAGVKDSGIVFGSHGGLLDRIDSWLPVLPFLALVSSFIT